MLKPSIKPQQLVGVLSLAGMAAVFINLALAITAFTPQAQPTGYVAQDEISNFNLTSGNETVYRPSYEQEFWSGNLYAYPVDAAGHIDTIAERWDRGAAASIDQQNFDTDRLIATMKDDGTKVPFRSASLSVAQQGSLTATINLVAYTSTDIVNFLRGDRSNEGTTGTPKLRVRASALGDIIHSRPYYIADATYPTIFVGANDGMLHAINATNVTGGGSERWAYVPSMLLNKMVNLANTSYGTALNPHDYFVDGQINIATITSSGSRRVLVGTLGGGGRGLYALNIDGSGGLIANIETDAAGGVANKIMWEVAPTKVNYANPTTTNAYVNLGYTYGTPTIAKVSGTDAVIIGNGYNDGLGNYAGCTHATPNYTNCGGDYQAYLYVINAYTGQLIDAIQAGSSGTAASPNGLSTPIATDTDGNGSVDIAYAGDLNGTLWKFDLSTSTATALFTTSPAQPITSAPGVAQHPNGGHMINFGTGSMFTDSTLDTTTYYVYGIWDGAPVANTALVTQTIDPRSYTCASGTACAGNTSAVRRITSSITPNWASGGHLGWKVALPAGERILGEGTFVENGRFYFNSHNPTVSYDVPSTTTTVWGENWLMELDYLSGGSKNLPFLDMDENLLLDNGDRIKYISTDSPIPPSCNLSDAAVAVSTACSIPGTDGIPVGKWLSRGVQSQPILVQLQTLNTTLFNQNPDVVFPHPNLDLGVSGGHFDEEIFYGSTGGTRATATLTIGSTGIVRPATLGGIQVNGITIVPALTTSDITNGTNTSTNAATIDSEVTSGFSASRSGSTLTVTAPVGSSFNGLGFNILAGTSSGSPGTAPSNGTLNISFVGDNKTVSLQCGSTYIGKTSPFTSLNTTSGDTAAKQGARLDDLYTKINTTLNGYTITCTKNGSPTSSLSCPVAAPVGASACSSGFTVDSDITTTTNTGPSGGTANTGWDNLAPFITGGTFSGGVDATPGNPCTSNCDYQVHIHQYDDKYNKTGVNMLNASNATLNLVKAIPLTTTNFKVIAHNQYLNPAVKIHIGDDTYLYNIDAGYTRIKDFVTSTTLLVANLPTYNRGNIGSLTINMPTDALTAKNWWGNGDVRAGVLPTKPQCVWDSAGANDGNMYRPVIPPTNGVDGPGTKGYSISTTPATATGARHGGALVIQIIKDTTPDSALEQNVSGRPEYGWRVKSANFATYVLAEYATFWHHPNNLCLDSAGWTKTPPADDSSTTQQSPAAGSTDPKIGDLAGTDGGTVTSVIRTVAGNVTTYTITYSTGHTATVVRTANADGTITIVTTDADGNVTTETIASASGAIMTGGDERGSQARTGRVSWHELIRQ